MSRQRRGKGGETEIEEDKDDGREEEVEERVQTGEKKERGGNSGNVRGGKKIERLGGCEGEMERKKGEVARLDESPPRELVVPLLIRR